jgi:F-type H+-transporting ATPase subunit gamma
MSGALLEIKKKIGGVKNTRKITKAMQLVAASKMRQFQKRAVSSRRYVWDLLAILQNNLGSQEQSLYTEARSTGKTLFVLYTSDKGLCGPLNTKLINALFRSNRWNDLKAEDRELIAIGKKSLDFARNNDIPVAKQYTQIPEKITGLDAIEIVDGILERWRDGDVKEVVFVAPHYKNSFTFYPVLKTFLPFSEETIQSTLGHLEDNEKPEMVQSDNHFMIFNPEEGHVLNRLYEQMIQALFLQSFLELKASEYSSRMIAMQNATDSADRIVSDLTRDFNKARQAAITQEIAELISGAASLEDED